MRILDNLNLNCYPESTQYRGTERMMDDAEAHPALPPRPAFGIDAPGLLAVAAATRAAKREEFSMDGWCGTKCCAVGHFCKAHPDDDLFVNADVPRFGNSSLGLHSNPAVESFYAVASRFGISPQDALYLFDSSEYKAYDEDGSYIGIGREEVAERIERFVDEHHADHMEQSECRACSEIYDVEPDKAAEAMYCPKCEKRHAREEGGGL